MSGNSLPFQYGQAQPGSSGFAYGAHDRAEDSTRPFSSRGPSPPTMHSHLSHRASPSHTQTDSDGADAEAKRRKVQRACDVCRRKKIKCEGPMNSNSKNKCANCQEYGYDCTYVEAAKRRGPPKGYIDTLEQRCGRLEGVIQRLSPGFDYNAVVGPPLDRESFDVGSYQEQLRSMQIPAYPAIKRFAPPTSVPEQSPSGSPAPVLGLQPWKSFEQDPRRPGLPAKEAEIADQQQAIVRAINKLELKETPWRFHGKASAHHLVLMLGEIRASMSGQDWIEQVQHKQRPEYWQVPEWEIVVANDGQRSVDLSTWPPSELARKLIDGYFSSVNIQFPLLNRIIFNKQYSSELYKTNSDFAKLCLMVFANGARHVSDPRVYWPAEDALTEEGRDRIRADQHGALKFSAGWRWLRAFLKVGRSILKSPNLFDFQCQVLTCVFLQGSTVPHLVWIVSGLGLRMAQELGIHVRSILQKTDPVERALYNRAFWCLYHIDRYNCAAIGRSVALQDSDFDADYPIAVDDEYWDTGDPQRDFIQPPEAGMPKVAAFVHLLKLDHIMGATLRTIYAINKTTDSRTDPAGERAVVIQLDSALNSWADAVPDALRWDPHREDDVLFMLSGPLYCYYYYCQILNHRTFIPTPKQSDSIGLPSLAICSNASRAIANIVDATLRRQKRIQRSRPSVGSSIPVSFMLPTWTAAVVLLLNLFSGKQQPSERERAVADVNKCLAAMKEMEKTWRQAGKLSDVLAEISRDIDSVEVSASIQGQKRPHDASSQGPDRPNTPEQIFGLWPTNRHPAGSDYIAPTQDAMGMPGVEERLKGLFDPTMFESYAPPTETFATTIDDDLWSQLIAGYIHGADVPPSM